MAKKRNPPDSESAAPETPAEEQGPGFDERLGRLEELVGELEEGGLGLEQAIERYREGVRLLGGCRETLGRFRRQVEELSQGAEAVLRPYDEDPDLAGEAGDEPA